jgi:hypothetical protein
MLLPYWHFLTVHASGEFGVSVPSGWRYPGLNAVGIGNGSVNGFRMNGLVGNTSIAPSPVITSMSIGVWSTHACPHAGLPPISAAPPAINESLIKSRLLSFVMSSFFKFSPAVSNLSTQEWCATRIAGCQALGRVRDRILW